MEKQTYEQIATVADQAARLSEELRKVLDQLLKQVESTPNAAKGVLEELVKLESDLSKYPEILAKISEMYQIFANEPTYDEILELTRIVF